MQQKQHQHRTTPAALQLGPPRQLLVKHARLQATCRFHAQQQGSCAPRLLQTQPRLLQARAAAAAATTAAAAAAASPAGLLDMAVVAAASAASFKLLVLCAVVAWMSHRGMIPANSSQVMSRIAFSLTIPAMLLASTTKTLSSSSQVANLAAIPVFALLQILLGAGLGRMAAAAVEGRLPLTRALLGWGSLSPTPSAAAIAASTAAALRAPAAASALLPRSDKGLPDGLPQLVQIACSFGNTVTLPLMYLMTMLPGAEASRATGYMALFHAAWSPCLWLFGYKSIQAAGQKGLGSRKRRRAGFRGAWRSYWTRVAAAAGLRPAPSPSAGASSSAGRSSSSSSFAAPSGQPVLITKQLPPSAAGGGGRPGQSGRAVYAVTSDEEGAADESPAEALVRRLVALGRALAGVELLQQAAKAINPPVAAAIGGLVLGLTPAGKLLSDGSAAAAFVATHATTPFTTWELSLLLGMLQCCWQTVELLASGTLALQALVLAASLFGARPGSSSSSTAAGAGGTQSSGSGSSAASWRAPGGQQGTVEVESPGGVRVDMDGGSSSSSDDESSPDLPDSDGSTTSSSGRSSSTSTSISGGSELGPKVLTGINVVHRSAGTADDASVSVLSQLRPQAAWEWRAMLSVAVVRFLLLPAATTGLVLLALRLGVMPPDPVCAFMLLLQASMPPAQNLVLMVQLQPSTAGLAPATARLLLQLYTLAVLPVTLWASVFAKLVL